jgi:hypothetical protein
MASINNRESYLRQRIIWYCILSISLAHIKYTKLVYFALNKGNNKITELRAILQRESQNS